MVQAIGGALLMANSAAIITDAFPAEQLGFALGMNMVVGILGSFLGILVGGLLSQVGWRWVFLANVPIGAFGTVWAYLKLKEIGIRIKAKLDWLGNISFAAGLAMILTGVTYGIKPYGHSLTGWGGPVRAGDDLRRSRASHRLRFHRDEGGRTHVPSVAVSHPGVHRRQRSVVPRCGRAGRLPVHVDDLVPGHLAPSARLQLHENPAVGRDLHDPVHDRLRGLRADLRQAVGPLRRPALRHGRDAALGGDVRGDDGLPGQLLLPALRAR